MSLETANCHLRHLVATPEQVRSIDRRTAEAYGLPTLALMENAGAAVAREALKLLAPDGRSGRPSEPGRTRVVVLAGKGQNGGDGLVSARHLEAAGVPVRVYLAARPDQVSGDAGLNLKVLMKSRVEVTLLGDERDFISGLLAAIGDCELIVDALLGLGFRSPLASFYSDLIRIVNNSGRPVLAVDVPSGLDAGTGQVTEPYVMATRTLTLGLLKPGLLLGPGRQYCGQVLLDSIGIPPAAISDEKIDLCRVEREAVRRWVPRRSANDHKGSHGRLLVLAGSPGYTGAAALAATSALRAGVGLVTLGVPARIFEPMVRKVTEVMLRGYPATEEGNLSLGAIPEILEDSGQFSAVALGPGLGTGAAEFVRLILPAVLGRGLPVVLDADGITAFSGSPGDLLGALRGAALGSPVAERSGLVITPHPGEMARLLGITSQEVQTDRIGTARRAAIETGCVVVLKGAPAILATTEPDGGTRAFINSTGNPALATAGSGDVLTGIIGSLLAGGTPALDAALTGVYLHGLAGDLLAARHGSVGLVAGDVARALPRAIKEVSV